MRLFPREESFLPQFRKASDVLVEAAKALEDLSASFDDIEVKVARIKHLEHEGDQVAHQTFGLLSSTWITPIDREDIYALVKALDDVLDEIDAVAARILLYKIEKPSPEMRAATALISQSAVAIQRAVPMLDDLKQSPAILAACVEINRLENEADSLFRISIGNLFENERDPIRLMKWKEIYEKLENTTDRCEDVANVLEQIVIKNS
ncbi:MAG: DUF47 domain-containing protein [Acidobacteria bacterium]|nr:DUF47 domain-containing protein [Acidobacteriota bacterium]